MSVRRPSPLYNAGTARPERRQARDPRVTMTRPGTRGAARTWMRRRRRRRPRGARGGGDGLGRESGCATTTMRRARWVVAVVSCVLRASGDGALGRDSGAGPTIFGIAAQPRSNRRVQGRVRSSRTPCASPPSQQLDLERSTSRPARLADRLAARPLAARARPRGSSASGSD